MTSKNKYSFVSSPLFLGLAAILATASSLFLSGGKYSMPSNEWIPLLSGFTDINFYSATTSVLLTIAFTGITSVILYNLNSRHVVTGKSSMSLVFLYVILQFSSPSTIFFSGVTVAAPLVLLSFSNTLVTNKDDRTLFNASFLISTASLLDFKMVVFVLPVFYYSLRSNSFSIRNLFLSIGSFALPYLLVFSLRHIFFQDTSLFAELLWRDLAALSAPQLKIESVANMVLLVYALYIAYRSFSTLLLKLSSYKIVKAMALVRFMVLVIITSSIILFYPQADGNYISLLAIPASFLLNEYPGKDNSKNKRVELLILLILIFLYRLSEFM
ncbi:MAG: hypothetical protein WC077_01550 [Bacteroidales bacterium]|jgi:hypothetical protein|nr:hypothetical protein [Bacteroidales bacterium]